MCVVLSRIVCFAGTTIQQPSALLVKPFLSSTRVTAKALPGAEIWFNDPKQKVRTSDRPQSKLLVGYFCVLLLSPRKIR